MKFLLETFASQTHGGGVTHPLLSCICKAQTPQLRRWLLCQNGSR